MIDFGGKKIIDIKIHIDDKSFPRIKKIKTYKNEVLYDNYDTTISLDTKNIENKYKEVTSKSSTIQHLNVYDGYHFYIDIQNDHYLVTDITCTSFELDEVSDDYVSIRKDFGEIFFKKEGNYLVTVTYQTYTYLLYVYVSDFTVSIQ